MFIYGTVNGGISCPSITSHSKLCGTEIFPSIHDDPSFLKQSAQRNDLSPLARSAFIFVILLRTTFVLYGEHFVDL